jgi:hypothetical protein
MVLGWKVAVNGVRDSDAGMRRHPAVVVLVTVLMLEAAALAAATVYFVVELLVGRPSSVGSAVAITAVIAVGAIWVGFIAVGVLRGRAWTRAATVVVQVLVGAIAIGSLQGSDPQPSLAVAMLVPAVVATVLLFSKPVIAATATRESDDRTF